jgi:hypothetical protein
MPRLTVPSLGLSKGFWSSIVEAVDATQPGTVANIHMPVDTSTFDCGSRSQALLDR